MTPFREREPFREPPFRELGLLACWVPARRAAKVDPIIALRAE